MPFPIILINSNTGSDTLASGAGPNIALTGSAANTSGDGLIITLDGSPDLTNVATDGSHAIFINDSTSGARNFSMIIGKNDTTKTITVANAFRINATGLSWAIGGKLATLNAATTRKLFNNNNTVGDAMGGWTIELQSDQTITSSIIIYRNYLPKFLLIRSDSTIRKITATQLYPTVFQIAGSAVVFDSIWFRGSHPVKGASSAVIVGNGYSGNYKTTVLNCIVGGDPGMGFSHGIQAYYGHARVTNCNISYNDKGIGQSDQNDPFLEAYNNIIFNNTIGIDVYTNHTRLGKYYNNIIYNNTSHGISIFTRNTFLSSLRLDGNTIYNNGGDGIRLNSNSSDTFGVPYNAWYEVPCNNNIICKNSGYGINMTGAGINDEFLYNMRTEFYNNNFGIGTTANVSGAFNPFSPSVQSGSLFIDPQFVNPSNGDFRIGANLQALGWPQFNIGLGVARSYVDIGALQRKNPEQAYLLLART